MKDYSVINKNEVPMLAITQINLENIMLSDKTEKPDTKATLV